MAVGITSFGDKNAADDKSVTELQLEIKVL